MAAVWPVQARGHIDALLFVDLFALALPIEGEIVTL